MRPIVVSFDMIKVGGGLESIIIPIKLLHPSSDERCEYSGVTEFVNGLTCE